MTERVVFPHPRTKIVQLPQPVVVVDEPKPARRRERTRSRSAVDGKFVTATEAAADPAETVTEDVKEVSMTDTPTPYPPAQPPTPAPPAQPGGPGPAGDE